MKKLWQVRIEFETVVYAEDSLDAEDAARDALDDQVVRAVKPTIEALGLEDDEADAVLETRIAKVKDLCGKWFEYGEYLVVEIDTEAKTCTVVENGR